MKRCGIGISALFLAAVALGQDQRYNGERPPKPDVPYLLHAEKLVETEQGEAKEEERKKERANTMPGAASPVRTPMAEPIFLFESEKIQPQKLALYQLDVVKGQREISFPKDPRDQVRKGPFPKHVTVRKLDDKLYWVEVNEVLDNGQYCLSPEGSQTIFCFEVY